METSPASEQIEPAPRAASERSGVGTGDIVVTANRREETLSRVPISVAALSQEDLTQRGVRSITDLATLTTGVNFTQNSPVRGFNIAIRGVDSRVGAGTVGVYIDDTPIQVRRLGAFSTTIYPQIFDLQRIEVLRGPQGTLFGAGAQGGLVRFITPEPDLNEVSFNGRGELASTENGGLSYEGGVAAGVPLIADRLALRLSAFYRRDTGWVDRVNTDTGEVTEKDANRMTTLALRAALAWRPVEAVTLTPSVFYQRRRIRNSNQFWTVQPATPGTTGVLQPSRTFTRPLSDADDAEFLSGDVQGQPATEEFLLASLKGEVELGAVTAIANLGYFDSEQSAFLDFSTASVAVITRGAFNRLPGYTGFSLQADTQKNYTAELRLQPSIPGERFNWIIGGFFASQRQENIGSISGNNIDFLFNAIGRLQGNPNLTFPAPLLQPGNQLLIGESSTLDKQYAGFGELSFNVTPELKLTAGARVSRTIVDFENLRDGPFAGGREFTQLTAKSTPITPKFNASYQPDGDNLFYATAAKGFRVGGANAQLPSFLCADGQAAIGLPRVPDSYEPDTLWSYEVGTKNKLLDRRFSIDASAFRIDWKDLQQQVFLPCQFFYVTNAGKARSQGFDVQLTMRPIQSLTFSASVGHIDAQYTQTVLPGPVARTGPGSVIVSDGDTIDNPPWTVNLYARQEFPLGQARAYLIGDFTHRSRNKGQSPVQNPLSVAFEGYPTIDATNALNLRAGTDFGRIDASIFVTNITNDFPTVYYRQDFPGVLLRRNASVRPRTVGLTVAVR